MNKIIFCNHPIKVKSGFKKFLLLKFPIYNYKPCGMCAGCRDYITLVNTTNFFEKNTCTRSTFF